MAWSRRSRQPLGFVGSAFEQYHAGLHRFLMRRLRSRQNAQDLAQETYLRLLRMDSHELVRKPQAYLYRIASNLVYEFKLRERNEPVAFDSQALEEAAESAAHPLDSSETVSHAQQLESILGQLPPLYRAVFLARKRDGMSYAEIARALDISVHTVKKYLARAVAQCRCARWDR
ncbi:MAG TPA: RNA polymerase sigma factor [Steroidobacteraceae bacterium]|jgi:RNA polymerase sigma-70 factor (ECF subfamily)|nr:RNA polymerase sigma factor [Steroidobacteraceae bacterium]